MKNILKLFCLLSFATSVYAADGFELGQPREGWSFTEVSLIPIQGGGRIKPLGSFAYEASVFLTGSKKYQGWNPIDLLFSWITDPQGWSEKKFLRITRKDVLRQLLLDENTHYFSPNELRANPVVMQYARGMMQSGGQVGKPGEMKLNPRDDELKQVISRLGFFDSITSGSAWLVVPEPAPAEWKNLDDLKMVQSGSKKQIRDHFLGLIKAYYEGHQADFQREAILARGAIEGEIPNWKTEWEGKVTAESLYNRTEPFKWSWIFYLVASIFFTICVLVQKQTHSGFAAWAGSFAMGATWIGLFIQTFGFILRCFIAGRPPVSNMYESIIWVSFGAMIFSLFLYWKTHEKVLLAVSTAVGGLGLLVADSAPAVLDASIQPLVPVLRSNLWLTVHVLTITLSYAAFALAFGLGMICLYQYIRRKNATPRGRKTVENLNQLSYRAMQIGVVLVAAGTILGGVWADYSWGRFWGWDPKEVWALITLLSYIAVLHGRLIGWIGAFGFAATNVICFLTVVFAWYGVNFVLGVGLHSYGFSAGGMSYVLTACGILLVYVLFAFLRFKFQPKPSTT